MNNHAASLSLASGRIWWVIAAAVTALCLATLWSMTQGEMPITYRAALTQLFKPENSVEGFVIWEMRLPRVLTGAFAGAGLGMAGVIMQSISRNPLASPSLTGVTSGAALAMVGGYIFFNLSLSWMLLAGTLGGFAAALTTFSIAWKTRLDPTHLVLAGMSVSLFCAAGIMTLLVAAANEANGLYFWLVGSLADRTWDHFDLLYLWVLCGLLAGLLCFRPLNLLAMDEEVCEMLGLSTRRWRLLLGIIAVVLTAATVAVAGPIAFAGLLVPHIVRLAIGNGHYSNHLTALPLAALVGAALICSADALAKNQGVPVGIVSAILGGPLLLWLIQTQASV